MYKISKGVQKPIMFKGFKGKYIYMAGGILLTALVEMVVFSSFIGFLLSMIIGIAIGTIGIAYVLRTQTKGLYKKNNKKGVFLVKNKLSNFK